MTVTLDAPTDLSPRLHTAHTIAAPASPGAGYMATATTFATRTLKQFVRTPQLIVLGAAISTMFLLIFRYVFGGAIGTGVEYADFLIPGLAAAGAFFSGTGAAVGVADDLDSGLYDRMRSLPVPRSAVLLGRSIADTALVAWGLFCTVAVGLLTGFRFHGSFSDAVLAVALCVLYGSAFTWPFITMGLVAGNAQAANGMAMMAFPLVFVSSAYVPVESMPGWMRPIAEHQPITVMVNAIRALSLGDDAALVLPHAAGWYIARSIVWALAIAAVFIPLSARIFARK